MMMHDLAVPALAVPGPAAALCSRRNAGSERPPIPADASSLRRETTAAGSGWVIRGRRGVEGGSHYCTRSIDVRQCVLEYRLQPADVSVRRNVSSHPTA